MISIKLINSTWPPKDGEYSHTIILNYDNWDDYHYKTLFGMYYCDNDKVVHEIGSVKIYYWPHDEDRSNNFTKHTRETLKEQIDELDSNYCSLGQDLSYYKTLKATLPEECKGG